MSDVCKNQYCDESTNALGLCQRCYSYESMTGKPRPPELILWPGKGHPLATTKDVVQMTGMTFRMVDYAIRSFNIVTTVEGNGSGHQRGWSVFDVAHLLITYAVVSLPTGTGRSPNPLQLCDVGCILGGYVLDCMQVGKLCRFLPAKRPRSPYGKPRHPGCVLV